MTHPHGPLKPSVVRAGIDTCQQPATQALDSGVAWRTFLPICQAQGGVAEPTLAPVAASAGVTCARRVGDRVARGEPLYAVYAHSPGELEYALDYARSHPDIVCLEDPR